MIPISGPGSWIGGLVFVAAGFVFALYLVQTLLPRLRDLTGSGSEADRRTQALLDRYRMEQAMKDEADLLMGVGEDPARYKQREANPEGHHEVKGARPSASAGDR